MVKLRSGAQATEDDEIAALLQATDALVPHLHVRPSLIPGGGMGLFTSVDLPAQRPIVLYYGVLGHDKAHGRYCIQVAPQLTLDAEALLSFVEDERTGSEVPNLGRYVNDCKGHEGDGVDNNMRYGRLLRFEQEEEGKSKRPPCVVMYSRRRIKAGEELFASYGKRYWAQWGGLLGGEGEERRRNE